MKQVKAFMIFTAMTAGALVVLNLADRFSGGMIRGVGAR